MKKIVIVELAEERKQFEAKVLSKSQHLRALNGFMNEFVTIDAEECFKSDNIREYFIKQLDEKYSADFPSYVKLNKVLDLVGVSMEKFDFLLKKYNEIVIENYDPINQQAKIPDFSIYAETPDQIERYHESDAVVKALNKVDSKIVQGVLGRSQLAQMLRVISYDHIKQQITINKEYVLRGF